MEFGEKLKMTRSNKKMTQDEFSKIIGVSRTAVSNWENERNYPDLKTLIEISKILEISLDELLIDDQKFIQKIEADNEELARLKKGAGMIQKFAIAGSVVSLLLSAFLWGSYLFFYDPHVGALPLLGCTFSGVLGMLSAALLENKQIKLLLMTINAILILSFPLLLLWGLSQGF